MQKRWKIGKKNKLKKKKQIGKKVGIDAFNLNEVSTMT
jgi:hypothetical protein